MGARRATCAALLAAAACGLAPAPEAKAHAAFLQSSPSPGQRLAGAPAQVRLRFSEPLDPSLSRVTMVDLASRRRVPARVQREGSRELVVRPQRALGVAAYRVDWHTVSTRDGHPLEGSFSFGVGTAAAGGAHQIEQSPLARGGWLRIVMRAGFYAALFFFAGGVLNALLLSPRRHPAAWLVAGTTSGAGAGPSPADRLWQRTLDAGWLAVGTGVVTTLIEAARAGRGLNLDDISGFLLSNTSGLARVAMVAALLVAAASARRAPWLAAGACAVCFYAIALSGHANSAAPRLVALLSDWVHLMGAAIWVGGIAQIALSRAPGSGDGSGEVMGSVLPRFGRVALPAFLAVVGAGLVNALVQLGRVQSLWQTAYGRVLALKVAAVALIVVASALHALWIRPRLVGASAGRSQPLERSHWRLLGSEPLLGLLVAAAAAALVAFPLPPRQLVAAEGARSASASSVCRPCPVPAPRADELAVADGLGSRLAALWLRRVPGGLQGRLLLYEVDGRWSTIPARVVGARQRGCGAGCWSFSLSGAPTTVEVRATEHGRPYTARIPARWDPAGSRRARVLLGRAQRAMNALAGLRQHETVTSGPGSAAATTYRLRAPDRMAYVTDRGVSSVVIGRWQWSREPGLPGWRRTRYGGGGPPFTTRTWFRWTAYAPAVRLLSSQQRGGRRIAEVALVDPGTPVWFRIQVDLATMRVPEDRMVARAHFMTQRYYDFDRPATIEPPAGVR